MYEFTRYRAIEWVKCDDPLQDSELFIERIKEMYKGNSERVQLKIYEKTECDLPIIFIKKTLTTLSSSNSSQVVELYVFHSKDLMFTDEGKYKFEHMAKDI